MSKTCTETTMETFPVLFAFLLLGALGGVLGIGPPDREFDCRYPDRCDPSDNRQYCLVNGDYAWGHCAAKRAVCRYRIYLDPLGRCSCRFNPNGPFCNLPGDRPRDRPGPPGPRFD